MCPAPGTSIGLVPSGRIAVAGFTDGTLRLFDLTGTFARDRNHPANRHAAARRADELFDDDASSSSSEGTLGSSDGSASSAAGKVRGVSVDSRSNQRYGAVACQIHARGVHTSLRMDVAVSEDGLYAFGGVQRGSVELVAVYLGDVESYLDERTEVADGNDGNKNGMATEAPGLLDLISVDRHADAKLKGFGACKRLWNGWERATKSGERPEYLLFTGKGIKVRSSFRILSREHAKRSRSLMTCCFRPCIHTEHSHLVLPTVPPRLHGRGRGLRLDLPLRHPRQRHEHQPALLPPQCPWNAAGHQQERRPKAARVGPDVRTEADRGGWRRRWEPWIGRSAKTSRLR